MSDSPAPSLGTLSKDVRDRVSERWRGLVAYELFFRLISVGLLAPLAAVTLRLLLSRTGEVVVSNDRMAAFVLSPWGATTLLVTAALALAGLFLELAGLMLLLAERGTGSAVAALARAGARWPRLFVLGLVQVAGYVGVAVPFLVAIWAVYRGLLSEANINYYLTERPPEFLWAVAAAGLIAVGMLLSLAWLVTRWVHAVPLVAFEDASPLDALRKSWRETRGALWPVGRLVAGWMLVMTVVSSITGWLLNVVGTSIVELAPRNLAAALVTAGLLIPLHLVVAAVLSTITLVGLAILVVRVYERRFGTGAEPDLAKSPPPTSRMRIGLWSVAAGFLVVGLWIGFQAVSWVGRGEGVEVTAHRGSSRDAPENTLAALRSAIANGADFAEIDVQETRDGRLILLHDDDFMRIARDPRKVWEIDFDEARSLDVGSWFAPKFADERVATLDEAIKLAGDDLQLNIELKYNGHDQRLAERVVETIRDYDFTERCVITTLDDGGARRVRELASDLEVGLIVFEAVGDLRRLDVDFYSVNEAKVNRRFVRRLHAANKNVHVWTVNDPKRMRELIEIGVDNVITDDPATLVALLAERRELSDAERLLLAVRGFFTR